ncbi:MAG: gamma-glutamyltransferase [Acidobacteria bacterium]|nr:gamma-glutamyltransferase [Acidobacteriota bacterium]
MRITSIRAFCAGLLVIATLVVPHSFIRAQLPAGPYIHEAPSAKNAMVASQHEIASQIGVDVLRRGGNAIDAAIAVGIALAVVYPEAGNIGGGGFMLIRFPDGRSTAIDYRERAPKAATERMFLNDNGDPIRGEGSSTVGYRASGVPGTLAGFDMAFRKYGSGKIKWRDLIRPSREVAQRGFKLSKRFADLFVEYKGRMEPYADSDRIFLNRGRYLKEGELLRQPELAATLSRIERAGASEFYKGRTAKLIAADMKANNGLITEADLRDYLPVERTPLVGDYRGHKIITMPPPSSGGVVMLQTLNMLEAFDLASMDPASPERWHLVIESMKRAFADRAEYAGDPDHADIPTSWLISKDYAATRRASIDTAKATPSSAIKFGRQTPDGSMDTTHYTVVDKDGIVVSNTYTINDLFGSGVTIKGTGILMNDEMDDFTTAPGRPNLFELIQGERNIIKPGKRPLSSMTPTIVLTKDGKPWFAVGARGGPRIITAVTQTVINMIDHKMDLREAIDFPRAHHQWLPDSVRWEPVGLPDRTRRELTAKGHNLIANPGYVASATGIMISKDGRRVGVIDRRSDGKAIGY